MVTQCVQYSRSGVVCLDHQYPRCIDAREGLAYPRKRERRWSGCAPFLTVLGGLRTNEYMQVCDENDQPIPGLFNVGSMVGDYYANMYTFQLAGNNLGANCLTFGYLTGKALAEGTI